MENLIPLPRVKLGHFPTPLERMDRLRAVLGPECPTLLIKRDDCTGLASGGNKTRKLEYLMAEAIGLKATAVVTFGAIQSNHARQTAAAAAKLGMRCDLVLVDVVGRQTEAYTHSGNILLDSLTGAHLHCVRPQAIEEALAVISRAHEETGHVAHVIPFGGSSPTGAAAYANAFLEINRQAAAMDLPVDVIVHASSSNGTQAGLVAGSVLAGSDARISGVNVYGGDVRELAAGVHGLAHQTLVLGGRHDVPDIMNRIHVLDGFNGKGYGMPTADGLDAIRLLAAAEGIFLDPVYSGKAMAALIASVRTGRYRRDQTVVFLHTGGSPALFAYADEFVEDTESARQLSVH